MAKNERTTQTMTATDARQHFANLINETARQGTRVIIEKSGAPVAAVVPIADLIRLKSLDEQNRDLSGRLDWISEPFRGVPAEEVEEETEKIMAELREEDRLARQPFASKL